MQRLVSLLCGAAVGLPTAAVIAQSDEPTGVHLEEVVVTARKREESLQSVPVAVSVVSTQQMTNNLATDLSKLGELAPQVIIVPSGTGTGSIITIRGVASAPGDAGLDQSVAIEMDNVALSRGRIISAPLYDIAQVQILQGPQALFFGKNSPAGVISIQSANPTNTLDGYATAGYEFEADERFLEGAISGPITDSLSARLAFRTDETRGWIKNVATPRPDYLNPAVTVPGANWGQWGPESKDAAGRLSLLWAPTEDFKAALKVSYSRQRKNMGLANSEPFCINGQTVPVIGTTPIPEADCKKDGVKAQAGVAAQYAANYPYANGGVPYFKSDFTLTSLTLDQTFDAFSLTATTGYYDQQVSSLNTTDWTPYSSLWASQKESYRLLSQEVRGITSLDGPLNFMGGVYVEQHSRPFLNAPDLFHRFNPAAGNYATNVMKSKTEGDYVSAFAQVNWNITSTLELTAGARWSHDEKKIAIVNVEANPAMPTLRPAGSVLNARYEDDHVSPEATLSWHPREDQTLYVAYKTGYKAGGLSNPFLPSATQTAAGLIFAPEEAEGFEAGYKATVFDRRLRFDVVAYRYKYDNLQVVAFTPPASFVLQNAASSRIQGVQGSAEWLATQQLTLRGNFGFNDAEYESFPNSPCYQGQSVAAGCVGGVQDLSGQRLFNAPELAFSVGADYRLPIGSAWETTLSASASHSSSYNSATDRAPGGYQESFWLLNAAVRTGPKDGKYELALIGRNLSDTYYMSSVNAWAGTNNTNQYVGYFARPREVAVQLTARF